MGAERDEKTGLSRASMESIGALMAALADPNRIALLDVLRWGEASVQTLADTLDIPRRNVSHHLSILRGAGLLASRREGISVIYAIEDWGAWWLIEKPQRRSPATTEQGRGKRFVTPRARRIAHLSSPSETSVRAYAYG